MTTSGHQELSSREDEIILMISINILGGLLLLITLTVGWWLFRKTKNSLSRYKEVLSKHGKGTEELEELQILHRSSVHNLMFMSERRRSTMDVSIREGSVRHNRRLTSPFDSPLRNSKIGQRYVITFASDGMGDGITISNNIITNISSKSSGDSAGILFFLSTVTTTITKKKKKIKKKYRIHNRNGTSRGIEFRWCWIISSFN